MTTDDPIQVMILDDDSGDLVPYVIPRSQVVKLKALALVDNALCSSRSTSMVTTSDLTQEVFDEFRHALIWMTIDELRKLPS